MYFDAALKSDVGLKRNDNQDAGSSNPEIGLFLVADGMGAHRGGGTASKMAVSAICEVIEKEKKSNARKPKEYLEAAVQMANKNILDTSRSDSTLKGMGTTATIMLFYDDNVTIAHVGDSRCYYFHDKQLWQLTRDHSFVAEKLRAGIISREEASIDPQKNIITRSVGFEAKIKVDLYEKKIQSGDVFLLCSDGLSNMVENKRVAEIINQHLSETNGIEKATNALVNEANKNGGDDNVTVLIVKVLA